MHYKAQGFKSSGFHSANKVFPCFFMYIHSQDGKEIDEEEECPGPAGTSDMRRHGPATGGSRGVDLLTLSKEWPLAGYLGKCNLLDIGYECMCVSVSEYLGGLILREGGGSDTLE